MMFLLQEKLTHALLPHAACLAGLPHAWFFTCGLALSLLQRKPDEWRRLHATPLSGATAVSSESGLNKPTMSETTQPIPGQEEVRDPWPTSNVTSPGRVHKKRKQGTTATDKIDVLFKGVFGRKVARSTLEQETAQSLSRLEAKDIRHRGAGGCEGVEKDIGLGVIVDAIKAGLGGE